MKMSKYICTAYWREGEVYSVLDLGGTGCVIINDVVDIYRRLHKCIVNAMAQKLKEPIKDIKYDYYKQADGKNIESIDKSMNGNMWYEIGVSSIKGHTGQVIIALKEIQINKIDKNEIMANTKKFIESIKDTDIDTSIISENHINNMAIENNIESDACGQLSKEVNLSIYTDIGIIKININYPIIQNEE